MSKNTAAKNPHVDLSEMSNPKNYRTAKVIIPVPIKPNLFPIMVKPLHPKRVKRPRRIIIAKSVSIFLFLYSKNARKPSFFKTGMNGREFR